MNTQTPHGQSARLCLSKMPALMAMMALQLFMRLIALAPLIVPSTGMTLGLDRRYAPLAGLLSALVLYILIALPFRFYSRGTLMLMAEGRENKVPFRYGAWLKLTLQRILRFLPWGLPLIVYIAGFYYLWNMAPATQMPRLISGAGKLVGGKFLQGFIVWVGVLACALAPAAIGWRRHLAAEFIAVHTEDARLFPMAVQAKKACHGRLNKVTLQNIPFLLPAPAAVVFVLGMDLAPKFKGSVSSDFFTVLTAVTKMDFSPNALLTAGLMLTLLYLPFVFFRKCALAVALAESKRNG